jgi:hypothetical protein
MRKYFHKKNILFFITFLSYFILPIKSSALEYTLLEPSAFGSSITTTSSLGAFLGQAFSFGLALAAALAVIMIVWGGVQIMTTDSWSGKSEGKQRIQDAIWGLLLALVSYLILYTINPDILIFKL